MGQKASCLLRTIRQGKAAYVWEPTLRACVCARVEWWQGRQLQPMACSFAAPPPHRALLQADCPLLTE